MDIYARKDVNIASTEGSLFITAKGKIVINAGAQIVIDSSGITLNGSKIESKASLHKFMSGAKVSTELPALPLANAAYDEAFILLDKNTNKPLKNLEYRIKKANGNYEYGKTDDEGKTHLAQSMSTEKVQLELKSAYDEAFCVKDRDGKIMRGVEYRIKRESGKYEYGVTNKLGLTHTIYSDKPETLILEVKEK